MAIRARLLKQYKHPNKVKPWPVGQIVQGSSQFISDLIGAKIAEVYTDEYPPKTKMKFKLKQLK